MAKLYPFKYRFENPGIKPLKDDLWFESHQELLLRITNTPQGRDLLCIDRDFDGIEIVRFGKNYITGFLGLNGENVKLISDFRIGAKWANIIRYRWRDFVVLAREHYSDKVNSQTEILLDGQYRMAATTSTFYPSPSPGSPVDGAAYVFLDNSTWSVLVNHVGTGALWDSSAGSAQCYAQSAANSGYYSQLRRPIFGFDLSVLAGEIVESGTFSRYHTAKQTTLGGSAHANSAQLVFSANPASNTSLTATDYSTVGTTSFGKTPIQNSITLGAYTNVILNSSGIDYLNTKVGGIGFLGCKLGFDHVNDETPMNPYSGALNQGTSAHYADETGTTKDPKLVIVHSPALIPTGHYYYSHLM